MSTQAEKLKNITQNSDKSSDKTSKTKILAITSGKGGVGKSTISANIANILSKRGYKTAIFDGSISLANLDIIFNVKAKNNLLNLLKGECILKDIVIEVDKNLFLIPAESGDEILKFNDNDIYQKLLKEDSFFEDIDYLIIDTGSGVGKNVQTFLKLADEVVVITMPEPTAITDAYALIKITSNINQNINLIVNSTESEKEGRFIYEKIRKVAENNLKTPLFLNYLGYIKNSRLILRSIKFRQLFTNTHPNSLASYQLDKIVDNITFQLEHQAPDKKSKKSLGIFIKRLIEKI